MLNALQSGTDIPIHRHFVTFETCIVLNGLITDIIYDNYSDKVVSYHLVAIGENCGVQIPTG